MIPVKIIGMGLGPDDLTERYQRMITEADVLVGGRRHLWNYSSLPSEKIVIGKDIKNLIRQVENHARSQNVAVLASGDPLFYGIGRAFVNYLGKDNVEIYPNITSVAAAFARIKEPWDQAGIISFHGKKKNSGWLDELKGMDKIAVLTDPLNNPAELAKQMLENRVDYFRMCVLENMGSENENVRWYDIDKAASGTFKDPSVVILIKDSSRCEENYSSETEKPGLGMDESVFVHRNGLITKPEVRAVSISKLCLEEEHVLWDLGAGSGSVSIEAAGFIKKGRIFAVEKNRERIDDINQNMVLFGIKRIFPVLASLPDGLDDLPDPDRIFVGGGGKDLYEILDTALRRLVNGGIAVINTVLLGNVHTAMNVLEKHGFETEIVQIQVSRGHKMPWDLMLKAGNPVFVIKGKK